MGRKAGWAQPVSQRGAQAPATPATPFAAAQTQLSAFPASVLTPEPLCPPLTGALSFTAATVACSGVRRPPCTMEAGTARSSRPGSLTPCRPPRWPPGGPACGPLAGQDPGQQWEGRRAQRWSSAALCWCFEEQQGALGPEVGRGPSRLPLREPTPGGSGAAATGLSPALGTAACLLPRALPGHTGVRKSGIRGSRPAPPEDAPAHFPPRRMIEHICV